MLDVLLELKCKSVPRHKIYVGTAHSTRPQSKTVCRRVAIAEHFGETPPECYGTDVNLNPTRYAFGLGFKIANVANNLNLNPSAPPCAIASMMHRSQCHITRWDTVLLFALEPPPNMSCTSPSAPSGMCDVCRDQGEPGSGIATEDLTGRGGPRAHLSIQNTATGTPLLV